MPSRRLGSLGALELNGRAWLLRSAANPPPPPPPPPAGGEAPALSGVTWTQVDAVHPASAISLTVGWAQAVGGIGPFKYSIVDRINSKYTIVDGRYGVVEGYWTPFGTSADEIRIVVTDGRGDSVTSAPIPIRKTDGSAPVVSMNSPNPALNAWNDTFFGGPKFRPQLTGASGGPWSQTTANPDGTPNADWPQQSDFVLYRQRNVRPPAADTPLVFTFTDGAGGRQTLARTIRIRDFDPIADIEFKPLRLASTSTQPGTVIGTFAATTPANSPTFTIVDPSGLLAIDTQTRALSLLRTPSVVGNVTFTVNVSDGPASFSKQFTVAVQQGIALDPSRLTLANRNTALDNGTPRQHIGTVVVDGTFGSPPEYVILTQTRFNPKAVTSYYGPRIVLDRATGSLDATSLLSEGTDTLKISVSDGITTCTADITITVGRAATTTSYYVGAAAPPASVPAGAIRFLTWTEMRGACMNAHTDFKDIYLGDDSNPDAYANANGAGQDYGLRFAWQGPGRITFVGQSGQPEPTAHIGGVSSNDQQGGGDMRGKGALVLGDGDWTLVGLKVANTHGSDALKGLEAVRRDGETYGDTTLIGCLLVDNDQGLESGLNHGVVTADRCEFANSGTAHVGSGACHNIYIGNTWKFVMKDCVSRGATLGHLVKCRAMISEITGNRLFDGLVGSSSCCADFPNGGEVTFSNNFVEKGCMAMNPYAVQYAAEGVLYDRNTFTATGNTMSVLTLDGSHYGNPAAFAIFTQNNASGVPLTATITGNSVYATTASGARTRVAVTAGNQQNPAAVTETGTTILTTAPALNTARPYFYGALPALGPLYRHTLWTQDDFRNFTGVQQLHEIPQIRVARSAPVGTVLARLRARNDLEGQAANKFVAGTTAALVRDNVYYPERLADPWAANGLFAVAADSQGQAVLTVAGSLVGLASDGALYVQVRFTAPDGTLCDSRYPVLLTG